MSFTEMVAGARFVARLPAFLRRPLTVGEARAIVRRRLGARETDFLTLARTVIYDRPESPYRQLLRLAGCEYGDLAGLVTRDGLEGALRVLYRRGVYLTVEEFKGLRPVVRGSASVEVDPARCRNPLITPHVAVQSGGSRGVRTFIPVPLEFVRDRAVNKCLALNARGGPWHLAHWDVPGGGLTAVLSSCLAGTVPERWFSPVDPYDSGLHPRYRWSARAARWGSLLAGRPLPMPRHVPVVDPLPIAQWMNAVLRMGASPLLIGYSSAVVRLCRAARAAGLDLAGAQFAVDGEPLTRARLDVIRQTGAEAIPTYATSETGRMGEGCLNPAEVDEVHFLSDLHGVVQPGPGGGSPELPANTLLFSSLRPSTAFVLLNVSMGDQAVMSARSCGCPLEPLGWTTHLHDVRSQEKLTAAGMTFLDADVIRVLEEVLPARFGGAPTDYQLVEDEGADGRPRVALVVHPSVGPVPSKVMAQAFLAAIGGGSGAERMMGIVWRDAGLLRVERRPPVITASGKILHLHSMSHDRARRATPHASSGPRE